MSVRTMTIGGRPVAPSDTYEVIDPSTGLVLATAPQCSTTQLDDAMGAAEAAYRDWRRHDIDVRRACLKIAGEVLEAAVDEIASDLTAESGKTIVDARREVLGAAAMFKSFAELDLDPEILTDDDAAYAEVARKPLGVVALIPPWNGPIILSAWKIAPAVLAGNTVVVKPSPYTPLCSLRMGELLREAFPPGVLNVITGRDTLGELLTAHPVPRALSFTGSIGTGKRVAAVAARDLKRVVLELGGNDAAIVLPDVDLEAVADGLFWGAFRNNGQICIAIKRLYVHESRHDEVVDALVDRAVSARIGDPRLENTQLGPLCNRSQLDRVVDLVADAVASGAVVRCGGAALDGPGFYYPPTVLTGVEEGVRVVDDEQFTPVLPVMPYRDLDDALDRANGTPFGLGGSIWTSDVERGFEVAAQLECGTAWVNAHGVVAPHQPFAGVKSSGIGVENGRLGLHEFTDVHVRRRPACRP